MQRDFINPVVVKEIRQGLRARSFNASFMGLQLFMVLCMLFYLIALRKKGDLSDVSGFFWFFIGVPLIMISPLRGFSAIHEECRKKTLEIIYLTRLTAWQITFGKWLSLMVQNALLLTGVLPYLVLRYFLGGVNLADDLIMTGVLFFVSALLTACGVGLSPIENRFVRGVILVGALMSLYMVPFLIFGLMPHMSSSMFFTPWIIVAVALCLLLVLAFALEYGAGLIAPPAENHALRKRALAFLLLGGIMLARLAGAAWYIWIYGFVFLLPICVDALIEPMRFIASHYHANGQRTRALRVPFRLFYPGWPAGVFFVVTILGATTLFIHAYETGSDLLPFPLFITMTGTALLPLALIVLVKPYASKIALPYMTIQVTLFITIVILFTVCSALGSEEPAWLGTLPMAGLYLLIFDSGIIHAGTALTGVTTGLAALVIAIRMRPAWKHIIALEKQARTPPAPDRPPPD